MNSFERTHTSKYMQRAEMLEFLNMLNVTTSLVRLAESREDNKGVCGAFTVQVEPDEELFCVIIDLA